MAQNHSHGRRHRRTIARSPLTTTVSLNITGCGWRAVRVFPAVDLPLNRVNDTVSGLSNDSISIFRQRLGEFAALLAVCPNAHNAFVLGMSVLYFPVDVITIHVTSRTQIPNSEADQVVSVDRSRVHVCSQAETPAELDDIDAVAGQTGYLKKQKWRRYEKIVAPERETQ